MNIKITDLIRRPEDGAIHMVYWQASATKDGKTVTLDQNISLFPKDSSDSEFIPFENVTETDVISWIKELMPEEMMEAVEAELMEQFNEQPVPPVTNGLPWA